MIAADTIVVHYNEIALKLGHRKLFVSRLMANLRAGLADLGVGTIRSVAGRITIEGGRASLPAVMRRVALTPGVANLWCARALPRDLESLEREVAGLLGHWRPEGTFRVEVKRADKSFPVESPQVAARLGSIIVARTGASVDLKRADTVMYVLITNTAMYLALEKIEGCGGLPVRTGGGVVLMLSGGIDSPVAGLRMIRRGCRVHAIHFHSAPYLSGTSREKAKRLCAILARGHGPIRFDCVAFGAIQSEIVRSAPTALRVVLYRRMMMRIAEAIATETGSAAIVTGESLGQVASQTLTNMTTIAAAVGLPVLRPLVGMDKREIMDYARRAETYELSIVPDQDCCSLFVPKHPAIAATLEQVAAAEADLAVGSMVAAAAAERERLTISAEWQLETPALAAEIA
jgi:thiamine biosynthesis protein ThiI